MAVVEYGSSARQQIDEQDNPPVAESIRDFEDLAGQAFI